MATAIESAKGRKAVGMTTAARKRRGSFGRILRAELDEQNVSIRELARRVAEEDGHVENVRRLLHLYLSGEVSPREEMRERIADALSIDPTVFAEDAERQAERERLIEALEPLADILLDVARKARS